MSNIQNAIYTVTFDNDVSVDYECKVDMETKKIFNFEDVEHDNGFDWINQYITLQDGTEYDVHYVEYCSDGEYFWFEQIERD